MTSNHRRLDVRIARSAHSSWATMAKRLALALPENATIREVLSAGRRLGWRDELTRNVLASADGRRLVYHPGVAVWRKVA